MSSSRIKTELTAFSDTASYTYNTSSRSGFDSRDGLAKYVFNPWKASSHLPSQLILPLPLSAWKNGRHLSVDLDTNRERVATIPVSLWTSLTVRGGCKSTTAYDLTGLTSMPRFAMNPRNFPDSMPKSHLAGFNFILYCRRVSRHSRRSLTWSFACRLFTNMSSTYTSMEVAPAFLSLNGMIW